MTHDDRLRAVWQSVYDRELGFGGADRAERLANEAVAARERTTDLTPYRIALFSERPTMDEALEYAYMVARASDEPNAVITAIHVVLNTAIRLTGSTK